MARASTLSFLDGKICAIHKPCITIIISLWLGPSCDILTWALLRLLFVIWWLVFSPWYDPCRWTGHWESRTHQSLSFGSKEARERLQIFKFCLSRFWQKTYLLPPRLAVSWLKAQDGSNQFSSVKLEHSCRHVFFCVVVVDSCPGMTFAAEQSWFSNNDWCSGGFPFQWLVNNFFFILLN